MGPWRKRDLRPTQGPGSFLGGYSEETQIKAGFVWQKEAALGWPWGGTSLVVSVTSFGFLLCLLDLI